MFPRQETPSPSCTLYLFACSPIFIRLYLRLESVPLHFLLRSSSSSSRRHRFQPSPPFAAFYLFPSGYRCGDNNMQTFWYLQFECRKMGTESRDGTARGSPLNFSKTQPRLRARYSINHLDKDCRGNRYADKFLRNDRDSWYSNNIYYMYIYTYIYVCIALFHNY